MRELDTEMEMGHGNEAKIPGVGTRQVEMEEVDDEDM